MKYSIKKLGDKEIFKIIGSGIDFFKGEKKYYSTSSVQLNKIYEPESIITFTNRPSRANMQFQNGTVIFAKMKETNKVLIINEELEQNTIFSTGFAGIKGNDDLIFSGYLFYYFISEIFNKIKDNLSSGVTQIAINNSGISNIQIPLPPLPTQKLIVQKLDSAFENINKNIDLTKENLKNLEELNKSVLEKVFSEGEYEKIELGKISKIIGGGTPSKNKSQYYGGNILWATVRDMKVDIIEDTELKITKEGLKNSSTNIISTNGIIIATRVGLGKVCYISKDTAINQDLKGIIPNERLSKHYLYRFFQSIEKYILENGTGATVKGVKLDFIKQIQIPLPPLQKQKEIVSYLDQVFEKNKQLKTKYELQLKELEELKQSLLKDAFEGKLVKE